MFDASLISAYPNKIKTIVNKTSPENVSDVRSFLGMTRYVSRLICDYATMTEPVRKLTRQDVEWKWSQTEQVFNNLKQSLTRTPVMAYFNPENETSVLVDASPVSIGAILTQNRKMICYPSRALTPTEHRYSQTDREFLAVVNGVEHVNLYLFDSHFAVVTYHKPLLGIVNSPKPSTKMSPFEALTCHKMKIGLPDSPTPSQSRRPVHSRTA